MANTALSSSSFHGRRRRSSCEYVGKVSRPPKLQRSFWATIDLGSTLLDTAKSSLRSAISDNEEAASPGANFRSSFMRKYSEKSLTKQPVQPQPSITDEFNNLSHQHSKYKRIIDDVKGEYEESKNFELFRRYNKLKGIIKRCIMYAKIGALPDLTGAMGGMGTMGGCMVLNSGSKGYLPNVAAEVPKAEIPEKVESLKRRISLLRGQIETLVERYEHSKRYVFFQRYRLMKAMIKNLTDTCSEY